MFFSASLAFSCFLSPVFWLSISLSSLLVSIVSLAFPLSLTFPLSYFPFYFFSISLSSLLFFLSLSFLISSIPSLLFSPLLFTFSLILLYISLYLSLLLTSLWFSLSLAFSPCFPLHCFLLLYFFSVTLCLSVSISHSFLFTLFSSFSRYLSPLLVSCLSLAVHISCFPLFCCISLV